MEGRVMCMWVLGLAVVLLVLEVRGDISCQEAVIKIMPCQPYLVGTGPPTPSAPCCAAVVDLNKEASTTKIRRDLCVCFLKAAKAFKVVPGRAKQLPGSCGVTLGFPIDPSIDLKKLALKLNSTCSSWQPKFQITISASTYDAAIEFVI